MTQKKSLADAMNAQPGPDSLAYWLAPLQGYLDRQGRYANEGLALADQGAGELRNANPWGALNMPLGVLGYLTSPINALLPSSDEIDATNMSPEAQRLLTAGTAGMMAVMPGGKGPKGILSTRPGLGRGLGDLLHGGSQAEQRALRARLEAEMAQARQMEAEGFIGNGPPEMNPRGPGTSGPPGILSSRPGMIRNDRSGASAAAAGAPVTQPQGITAYHGSPHTFDKFDMSKIGTGEGNQSFGHGLYLAEAEDVAQQYSRNLGGDGGSMYQVRINAKPEEFLDWDAPLSKQPDQVRSTLVDLMERTPPVDHPGSTIYGRVSEALGGAKGIPNEQMTEVLKQRGIKGIRYKDAGSRGAEGGTYNYVVFDDSIIDILKRYGIPMTAGVGGAMVVTGANMPPELAAQMQEG